MTGSCKNIKGTSPGLITSHVFASRPPGHSLSGERDISNSEKENGHQWASMIWSPYLEGDGFFICSAKTYAKEFDPSLNVSCLFG